ncbi:hypothetical protein GCM10022384_02000 [Streptomyces marokkonensis]|uniref:Uncharacterized protein n=1 Tax=Streptomyces marokkonensis TaxID=324855 RepID=A0ABP7NS28_9ACTN
MEVRRCLGQPPDEPLGPVQRVTLLRGRNLDEGAQFAGAQDGADGQDAGGAVDAQLRLEPSVEAELVGEEIAALVGVRSALGALDGQHLPAEFATQPERPV